jgi:hypothetical protein
MLEALRVHGCGAQAERRNDITRARARCGSMISGEGIAGRVPGCGGASAAARPSSCLRVLLAQPPFRVDRSVLPRACARGVPGARTRGVPEAFRPARRRVGRSRPFRRGRNLSSRAAACTSRAGPTHPRAWRRASCDARAPGRGVGVMTPGVPRGQRSSHVRCHPPAAPERRVRAGSFGPSSRCGPGCDGCGWDVAAALASGGRAEVRALDPQGPLSSERAQRRRRTRSVSRPCVHAPRTPCPSEGAVVSRRARVAPPRGKSKDVGRWDIVDGGSD